jgi:phage repressor protein C with HTH and peptisase S24 domain
MCIYYTLQGVFMKLNYIKEICRSVWMTMEELSQFTGIKGQRLRDISSGRVENFKPEELSIFVEKLHISPEWLMTGEGNLFQNGFERLPGHANEVVTRICNLMAPDNYLISQDEILDLPQGTVVKWLKKYSLPHWVIQRAADDLNKSYDFIVYGIEGEYQQPINSTRQELKQNEFNSKPVANDDQIDLPCLNIKASAGYGNEVLEERVIGRFQVSRSWVRNVLNCEPGKVDIIFVDGPSMEPTLLDGELVLVDRRCERFDNDAVYVIQYDGHLRIKRVQLKFDGGVIIKSDNSRFDPEQLSQEQAESLRVIGKVLPWKFGQFKL